MAGNTAERVEKLIAPTVKEMGYDLWDVRFLKEGASWYLRVFIDKEEGIWINDCTDVSHAIDPILDEADIIDKSYYLEVCSTGLERELLKPEHFEKMKGREVTVNLYRAVDGEKTFCGTLLDFDGGVKISLSGEERYFEKGLYSSVKLNDMTI
ncbi:MAG: ribosome maturation factor RimP [Clostridia bacterium]|nr:ribosome maturation factor RimP [Clostridia bacterium]